MKTYLLILLIIPASLFSRDIVLSKDGGPLNLTPYLYFYEDKKGSVTIDDIQKKEFQDNFIINSRDTPAFGITKSTIWGKFVIKNNNSTGSSWNIIFDYPALGHVDIYIPAAGQYIKHTAGIRYPVNDRLIRDRKIIIPFELKNFPVTVYFRVKSRYTIDLSMELMSQITLISYIKHETGVYGIFFGIILGLILYNIFVYLAIRDNSYIWYVLYTAANFITLAGIQSYLGEYLFPESYRAAVFTGNLAATLATVFAILFGRNFLYTGRRFPVIDKILLYTIPVILVNFFLGNTVFGATGHMIHIYIFFTLLPAGAALLLYVGLKSYKKHIYARHYTHAWLIYLLTIILYSLNTLNIINFRFLENYALETGASIEVILLSFALAHRIRVLQDQANKDSLTGLYNRRALQDFFEETTRQNGVKPDSIAFIIIDIDNFKNINDRFGHDTGDIILCEFAGILNKNVRSLDFVSRWGGEEFAILLPETSLENSILIAEKMRNKIAAHQFTTGQITASFGVSSYKAPENMRDFFHRTDQALYKAKKEGKNRTVAG